ncbi:hypothetical protein AB0395_29685 [Streptosporangium sp. NPDC051023]|uniref:hypothetical protein n=1 Tax=Streptosporangium sp. NPDC051023 TaxID=3155410 RepID=UPI00344E6DB0
MTTLTVCLLLVAGSRIELRPAARTPAQLAARITAASVRCRLGWLAAVFVAAPLYALLVASRGALWLALAALAWTACALTTALAMDGRAVRMVRTTGGRA